MTRPLEIAIVGGSIGGCAAASILTDQGHRVSVYERARGPLVGRGSGITTPRSTFDDLVAAGLVPKGLPHTRLASHAFVGRGEFGGDRGSTVLELPLDAVTLRWKDLWSGLRQGVPDAVYHDGREVTELSDVASDRPRLRFADGEEVDADVIVFADGRASFGRSLLFPRSERSYRGYVMWRGLLPDREVGDLAPIEGRMVRLSLPKLPGSSEYYLVPGADGSVEPGRRLVHWAHYLPVAAADLPESDASGGAEPFAGFHGDFEHALLAQVVAHLPTYYAEITKHTVETYLEPVRTFVPRTHHRSRVCLVGDAATVLPPFTGSGVFKSVRNARALADALATHDDVEAALTRWSDAATARAIGLVALAEQMERAYVWEPPDLARMTREETRAWWNAAVAFPDDFRMLGDDERS